MTLDEARALRRGDIVHDTLGQLWRVEDELHEAGGESRKTREGWLAIGISYLMRLIDIHSEAARKRIWLVSEHELERFHLPEARA